MAHESQNVAQLRKQLKDAIATELQQRINAEYETIRKTYEGKCFKYAATDKVYDAKTKDWVDKKYYHYTKILSIPKDSMYELADGRLSCSDTTMVMFYVTPSGSISLNKSAGYLHSISNYHTEITQGEYDKAMTGIIAKVAELSRL